MVSKNEVVAHVMLLEKVIEDLNLIKNTKDYDHLVGDELHLAAVHCNNTIDILHSRLGRMIIKGVDE